MAYTLEKLLAAGAVDVFFTPIYMKKNRPAVKLSVLCKEALIDSLTDIIFAETSTIGVRIREERRIILSRQSAVITTRYGELKVKETEFNGKKKITPEYEDAKLLAEKNGVALYKIYESIRNGIEEIND